MKNVKICFKGAGELASGIAHVLYTANLKNICMLELPEPRAVRRNVSFSTAVFEGQFEVETVPATLIQNAAELLATWENQKIAVYVDPLWSILRTTTFDIVIDAIVAKRNLGTRITEATLVIALGPGFTAGKDVHIVIETKRGHDLGRIITAGNAADNTGIPGNIGGFTAERVLRAPVEGYFQSNHSISDRIKKTETIGLVNNQEINAEVNGVLRGLMKSGTYVDKATKIGDIDPRGDESYCNTISDKARTIGGAVLTAILHRFNM